MNPSDTMPLDEAQIAHLFEEAGLREAPVPNMRRVEGVMERAMHETVIADTTSFVFSGFPAVLSSLLSAVVGKVSHPDQDYRA
ncbi:MAG: hypothetical protein ACPG32_09055 [Akkermansiaceae bacterium]